MLYIYMSSSPRTAIDRILAAGSALLALLLLNLPLSLYVWAPVGRPWLVLVPLVESVVMLWIAWLVSRPSLQSRTRRIATAVGGALYGILIGFAAAETFFRFYFARAFRPRGDIGMIRGALLLFFGDIGTLADVLAPIATALLFAALMALGIAALIGVRRLLRPAGATALSPALLTVLVVPLMLAVGLPRSLTGLTAGALVPSENQAFVEIDVDGVRRASLAGADGENAGGAPVVQPRTDYTFPGLKDRDVYFFAIEAYGYASVIRPHLAGRIDPHRERLAEVLAANGYGVRSSFLESPVAGGYSWLAEATMLTGQWIDSQERFLQLYDQSLPSLSGMLHDGGYYTLTVRPGTVHGEWPEGWDIFRFQESILAHGDGFSYRGPWFSYVPVTDQYALWFGEQRVRELIAPNGPAADRPLFAYYQLVSSHTPFNRIPPIIDPWSDLGDGSVYVERRDEIRTFDNTWTGGTELEEGYAAAIGYVFDVLSEYVEEVMADDRDPILVFYGDHQAQRPIRSPDAFLSVPIHVASRDEGVLSLFEHWGFQPGMKSDESPPHRRMDQFFPMFAELAATPIDAASIIR